MKRLLVIFGSIFLIGCAAHQGEKKVFTHPDYSGEAQAQKFQDDSIECKEHATLESGYFHTEMYNDCMENYGWNYKWVDEDD